jgi:esterase
MPDSQGGLSLYDAARAMGIAFTTEAVPKDMEIHVNGIKLHYLDWGNEEKPPMILLHGQTNSAHAWDFTALAFHDDFHVIALDQRGHGDSAWAVDGDYTLNTQLPDFEHFVDALELEDIYLVGFSMGGRIAMVYASMHPDKLRALAIIEMSPKMERREGRNTFAAWQLLPKDTDSFEEYVNAAHELNPRRTLTQLRGSLSHQLREFPNGKWSWKWDPVLRSTDVSGWSDDRLWEIVPQIRTPMLLVRGAESGFVSDETEYRMTQSLPAMKSVMIPGAGHMVPGDRPVQLQTELKDFLHPLM